MGSEGQPKDAERVDARTGRGAGHLVLALEEAQQAQARAVLALPVFGHLAHHAQVCEAETIFVLRVLGREQTCRDLPAPAVLASLRRTEQGQHVEVAFGVGPPAPENGEDVGPRSLSSRAMGTQREAEQTESRDMCARPRRLLGPIERQRGEDVEVQAIVVPSGLDPLQEPARTRHIRDGVGRVRLGVALANLEQRSQHTQRALLFGADEGGQVWDERVWLKVRVALHRRDQWKHEPDVVAGSFLLPVERHDKQVLIVRSRREPNKGNEAEALTLRPALPLQRGAERTDLAGRRLAVVERLQQRPQTHGRGVVVAPRGAFVRTREAYCRRRDQCKFESHGTPPKLPDHGLCACTSETLYSGARDIQSPVFLDGQSPVVGADAQRHGLAAAGSFEMLR